MSVCTVHTYSGQEEPSDRHVKQPSFKDLILLSDVDSNVIIHLNSDLVLLSSNSVSVLKSSIDILYVLVIVIPQKCSLFQSCEFKHFFFQLSLNIYCKTKQKNNMSQSRGVLEPLINQKVSIKDPTFPLNSCRLNGKNLSMSRLSCFYRSRVSSLLMACCRVAHSALVCTIERLLKGSKINICPVDSLKGRRPH